MWFTFFLKYFSAAFALLSIIRWIFKKRWGSVDKTNEISAKGKIVLITGANSGIGRSTALEFSYRDAHVILACRDNEKTKDAVGWIRALTTLGQLVCMNLDLSCFESIGNFCKEFKTKYDGLDILCNNAGVMMANGQREYTTDGYEIHMGVNHLEHFLLTNLLFEPLKKAAPIVKPGIPERTKFKGASDWMPPEVVKQRQTGDMGIMDMTSSADIFSLGCLFAFVLTKGSHPFGDDVPTREINILKYNPLIKSLINLDNE